MQWGLAVIILLGALGGAFFAPASAAWRSWPSATSSAAGEHRRRRRLHLQRGVPRAAPAGVPGERRRQRARAADDLLHDRPDRRLARERPLALRRPRYPALSYERGLSSRRRRRHRAGRHAAAAAAARARLPGRGDRAVRVRALGRARARRRAGRAGAQRAVDPGLRPGDLLRRRLDLGRVGAALRRGGRGRRRQLLALAHERRRAAGRRRGQPAGARRRTAASSPTPTARPCRWSWR